MELSPEVARYVVNFHWDLMSVEERLALRHLVATIKATGRSDLAAQGEARKSWSHLDAAIRRETRNEECITPLRYLSDDPSVMELAADGFEASNYARQPESSGNVQRRSDSTAVHSAIS